jgi:hypothetical protein
VEQRVELQEQTEHAPCIHCLDTGWVVMGAETEDGEIEEYFVLCRRCGARRRAWTISTES